MDEAAPDLWNRAGALASYSMRRLFERARLADWAKGLRQASAHVGSLAEELRRLYRQGAPSEATAADLLRDSDALDAAKRPVRDLVGAGSEARAARAEIVKGFAGAGWGDAYDFARAPGATVGALKLDDLDRLSDTLRRMAEMIDAWALLENKERTAKRTGARGRLPDVAATQLATWGEEHGIGPHDLARDLLRLRIEAPEPRDGVDPAALLADRLRKKPKRKK